MQQQTLDREDPTPTNENEALSVYEQVMSDPEARYAYFNTIQGVLYGDPLQDELKEVRRVLDEASIAYLFRADEGRPWPTFRSKELTGVGFDEISRLVAKLG